MTARLSATVLDTTDPRALAAFSAEVLLPGHVLAGLPRTSSAASAAAPSSTPP